MQNFKNIKFSKWRQYENIDLELDSNITIITGKNGCGKTTLLNVLARHFGWNVNLISTPQIGKNKKKFWSDIQSSIESDFDVPNNAVRVGSIEYDNNIVCDLMTQNQVSVQYNLTYQNQQSVFGLNIPSHRPKASYNAIPNIPTSPKTNQQQYQEFQNLMIQEYSGTASSRQSNPGKVIKESLISLAVFGYGNQVVQPNEEYKKLFEGFQEVLKKVLPPEIGFQKIEIRMPDVVLVTQTGSFILDAMSGGVNALFTIAWQIFMFGIDKEKATVMIDEPENHLHPSMQRDFLPNLSKAFPHYKFIIATHSPFIISSNPNSKVYALVHNEQGKVTSRLLKNQELSGSANEILREVLDVPVTTPIWVEEKVKSIIENNSNEKDDKKRVSAIFEELKKAGLIQAIKNLEIDK